MKVISGLLETGVSTEYKYLWKSTEDAQTSIQMYIDRTMKIDMDAARIEQAIQNKLNLRRTAASISEARQAKVLSLSVFGFTIITFIFTPLSFIASLLALDVDWFSNIKHQANATEIDGSGSEVYMGRKVIGIFRKCSLFHDRIVEHDAFLNA